MSFSICTFQEFPHAEDTYYLAHCYPYTFTDLKEDLDSMLNHQEKRQYIRREVLCETRAGNSCFLVTVSNFGKLRVYVLIICYKFVFLSELQRVL